jgi:hypothetical protein
VNAYLPRFYTNTQVGISKETELHVLFNNAYVQ